MSNQIRQVAPQPSAQPPLHPAVRATLTTLVVSVWAIALGGNIFWSYKHPSQSNSQVSAAPVVAVISRPARHGPGHVAEIVNIGEQPVDVCVRPGKPARLKPDGEMDCAEYCTTVPPCSVLGVGWRQGMAWEPGDEVVVEVSNSIEIRATVR